LIIVKSKNACKTEMCTKTADRGIHLQLINEEPLPKLMTSYTPYYDISSYYFIR